MSDAPGFVKRVQHLCSLSYIVFICFIQFIRRLVSCACRFLIHRTTFFWFQFCYFIILSISGFLLLKFLDPKDPSQRPGDLDLFFTSVSAATVSSMSTVEMEAFSNSQLIVITLLMLVGAEVFTSLLELQLLKIKFRQPEKAENRENTSDQGLSIELGTVPPNTSQHEQDKILPTSCEILRYRCLRYLSYVVLAYLLIVHVCGTLSILLYVNIVDSSRRVLETKGLQKEIFAVFAAVSSFANCGFLPTNENMVAFRNNSGLLLLIIPQVLLGKTLFPACLRLAVWVMGKIKKREEVDHILKKPKEIGYDQLLHPLHCILLVPSVIGFILVQFILFCCMEWKSNALTGMNSYQKLVGALFQSTNTRHAGETIVDISTLAPAILVLYVVMMYLPPYTSFLPILDGQKRPQRVGLLHSLIMSQLTYLSIFTILICITENKKMTNDPVNFSILNVAFEVTSAYGSVGFSTSYSCQRRLNQNDHCKDAFSGFAGRWSGKGKIVIILVMFFGRLKKYNINGGKAWKLR